MTPVPFEALHFQEAVLMQYIFASGWVIKETSDGVLFTAIPVKLKRRQKSVILQRYERSKRNWDRSLNKTPASMVWDTATLP